MLRQLISIAYVNYRYEDSKQPFHNDLPWAAAWLSSRVLMGLFPALSGFPSMKRHKHYQSKHSTFAYLTLQTWPKIILLKLRWKFLDPWTSREKSLEDNELPLIALFIIGNKPTRALMLQRNSAFKLLSFGSFEPSLSLVIMMVNSLV